MVGGGGRWCPWSRHQTRPCRWCAKASPRRTPTGTGPHPPPLPPATPATGRRGGQAPCDGPPWRPWRSIALSFPTRWRRPATATPAAAFLFCGGGGADGEHQLLLAWRTRMRPAVGGGGAPPCHRVWCGGLSSSLLCLLQPARQPASTATPQGRHAAAAAILGATKRRRATPPPPPPRPPPRTPPCARLPYPRLHPRRRVEPQPFSTGHRGALETGVGAHAAHRAVQEPQVGRFVFHITVTCASLGAVLGFDPLLRTRHRGKSGARRQARGAKRLAAGPGRRARRPRRSPRAARGC